MVKKIGFIIVLGIVILLASGSSDLSNTKAAEKDGEVPETEYETVTFDVDDLTPVTEEMLIGYKDEDYYKRMTNGAGFETATLDMDDLKNMISGDIIEYKDSDYFNNSSEYSHKTVLVSVDEEVLDREKVEALCEKYALSIMYDYANFAMYALTSETEFTDFELAKLIEDLSAEEGVLAAERDYICRITDGANLGVSLGLFD